MDPLIFPQAIQSKELGSPDPRPAMLAEAVGSKGRDPFGYTNPSVNLAWAPAGHNKELPLPIGRTREGKSGMQTPGACLRRRKEGPCESCIGDAAGWMFTRTRLWPA
jgi:hypothetical protein